jgi:hypothetical protein
MRKPMTSFQGTSGQPARNSLLRALADSPMISGKTLNGQPADPVPVPGVPAVLDNICDLVGRIEYVLHSQVIGPAHRSTD